jgi:sporulation protein YlmC with PRC-barrel domain
MTYSVHTTDTRRCKARHKLTKPIVVSAMLALSLAAPFALQPQPVWSQTVHLVEVDVKVAAAGYRASKLIGKSVLNDNDEDVGKLDDIVLGPDAKANFAILQVGGLLGIGSRLVAVPFESLKIDKAGDKIVLPGASKTALEKLTEFKYG